MLLLIKKSTSFDTSGTEFICSFSFGITSFTKIVNNEQKHLYNNNIIKK